MFRGHTSEWKSVSRRRARNSACNLTVFEGKYHCKYMNNNAFAQVRRPFFSVSPPNKNTPMRTCIGVPPSVLHPDPQRRRQTVERMHQAVERRHALPQTEGRHRATNQHATRGIGRSVAGVDQNPLASRHLHQARQSRPPGRRPSAGRAGKAWRNHVEPERIFARGNGRMRPRSGRFERGHGRLSALGGKKQHPLRAPGQVGGAAQTNQCRHLEKIDVVNEIRTPLAAPIWNCKGMPPEAPAAQPQTARHGGSAKALSAYPAAHIGNVEGGPSATLAAQPHTARHGGRAKVRSAHPAAHVVN